MMGEISGAASLPVCRSGTAAGLRQPCNAPATGAFSNPVQRIMPVNEFVIAVVLQKIHSVLDDHGGNQAIHVFGIELCLFQLYFHRPRRINTLCISAFIEVRKTNLEFILKTKLHLMLILSLLSLATTPGLKAQTYTNLHLFAGYPNDGANPQGGLVLLGMTLYGTTEFEGSSGNGGANSGSGTVFAVNTDSMGFTNLYNFTTTTVTFYGSANSDGARSLSSLVLSGNTLYGTASAGGAFGKGTVFSVNIVNMGFTNLHNFTTTSGALSTNSDGANPQAGLILSGNTLYGTATGGGTNGNGTVFAITTAGPPFTTLFATLHSFTATSGTSNANGDGANPHSSLILSGNTLYGTASAGGSSGNGTVFAINTNGTGFTNI
jgi:uncharacterized repeat protein (TIGR03803 family)